MAQSPLNYDSTPIPVRDRRLHVPSTFELRDALVAMIRDDNPQPYKNEAWVEPPKLYRREVADSIAQEYMEWADNALITNGPLDSILDDTTYTTTQRIHRIFSNDLLGNSDNAGNIDVAFLDDRLAPIRERHLPLQLVVPAFPFKDQGAFNTAGRPEDPDFGEVCLLVRMHCVSLALSKVHVQYVEWVIVSDGPLYATLFGLQEAVAENYLRRLRSIRDRLNLGSTIAILSLKEVIARTGFLYGRAEGRDPFEQFTEAIHIALLAIERDDAGLQKAIRDLTGVMMWNIDTRKHLTTAGGRKLWTALKTGRAALGREVYEMARNTAFKYAASNLALRFSRVLELQFPLALRATSHAKLGQVALPRTGSVRPWNGVAVVSTPERGWQDLKTMRLHQAWRKRITTAVHLHGADSPFYYTTE
jgi:hypothetical protein